MIKFIKKQIIKNKDLFLVFSIFLILSIPFTVEICSGYLSYVGLDKQEFLLWDYSSNNNLLPYKDFFYPYGIARFFRGVNFIYGFLYYLTVPLIFTSLFYIFRKVFNDKLLSYFSIFSLYFLIVGITGFDVFSRYGIFISLSLITSYIIFHLKNNSIVFFFVGLPLGIIFSLFNDQGTYVFLSVIFIYKLKILINRKDKKKIIQFGKEFLYLCLGVLTGLLPFLLFLFFTNSFSGYIEYFKEVGNISIVAKTPFFTFIASRANIFTLLALFGSIFYLCYKFFILKRKMDLTSFLQLTLVFDIFVLEQKSIIRSIDTQIVFVAYILFIILIFDLINNFSKIKTKFDTRLLFCFPIVFAFLFLPINNKNLDNLNISTISNNIKNSVNGVCFENNFNNLLQSNEKFSKVVNFLNNQSDFNGKTFSFPSGDSVFYVLLNQKPPYYNATFEGSSKKSQIKSIDYIKENKINYIILDMNKSSLQDSVPDYIRQPLVFKYIITNFNIVQKIGDLLILKKGSDDFIYSKILNEVPEYRDYLLNVNLYMIPYTEGVYKYHKLSNETDLGVLNNISSKDKIVVLENNLNTNRNVLTGLEVELIDGNKTTVYLNTCKKMEYCVINLSNIPLLYKERIIKSINVSKEFNGQVRIYENKSIYSLW